MKALVSKQRRKAPGKPDQGEPNSREPEPPTIVHASSARMTEVLDAQVALVLTGPPYFSKKVESWMQDEDRALEEPEGAEATREVMVRDTIRFAWGLRGVFEEVWRVTMPGGWAILQTRDVRFRQQLAPVEAIHRELMESQGFQLYTRYFWRPPHTRLTRRRMLNSLGRSFAPLPFDPEVFLVFFKPGAPRTGEPTSQDVELLTQESLVTPVGQQPVRHRHHSPVPLIQALVRSYSRPGDLVLDPFAGAGTIPRVALALGRRAIGYEVDPDSMDSIRKNLALTLAEPEHV